MKIEKYKGTKRIPEKNLFRKESLHFPGIDKITASWVCLSLIMAE